MSEPELLAPQSFNRNHMGVVILVEECKNTPCLSIIDFCQTVMKAGTRRPPRRSAGGGSIATKSTVTRDNLGDKLLPRRRLRCHSVAFGEMPQLEFGDKIVLPPKMLLELQCLKVPTPFMFKIQAYDPDAGESPEVTVQYCSVQEFSSPEGTVFLPYWMMQQLLIEEGAQIDISSVCDFPRGAYCRLQPETTDFLTLAADIGPKVLMESALRRYSVLAIDSSIVVIYGDEKFHLRVVELKPAPVVSLCGDVDLETDFTAPENADPKRPRSQDGQRINNQQLQNDGDICKGASTAETSIPEQQAAHTVTAKENPKRFEGSTTKISARSLQAAQHRIRQQIDSKAISISVVAARATENLTASHLRCAQPAFSSTGRCLSDSQNKVESTQQTLPLHVADSCHNLDDKYLTRTVESFPSQEPSSRCPLCLSDIPQSAKDMHAIRCARNPTYHKFECSICHERIAVSMKAQHIHCSQCSFVVSGSDELIAHEQDVHTLSVKCRDCSVMFNRSDLEEHQSQNKCPHAFEACTLCGLAFKQKDMPAHAISCSSRTDKCELCQCFVKVIDIDFHTCAGPRPSEIAFPKHDSLHFQANTNNDLSAAATVASSTFECAYCCKSGFRDAESLERHIAADCRIALSFAPKTQDNQHQERSSGVPVTNASSPDITAYTGPVPVRELLQGRLRRKEDASRVVRTRFPPINNNNNKSNNNSSNNDNSSSRIKTSKTLRINPATTKTNRAESMVRGTVQSLPAVPRQQKQLQPTSPPFGNIGSDLLSIQSAACRLSGSSANVKQRNHP